MFKKLLLSLTRRGDLALALLLGVVVFLMVLPVPTVLVDAFIAVNIAMAIALLMIGVYIPTPLSFSSLPSVLLLSTLFRLALTITTTRLILAQADAGEIVYAFGDFVVAGNLVVGIVVFLIITIVQFVVITKGAERVAEVSARFSLDGMPGKQMSIDADLRAGVIDTTEAVRRRSRLEQQSQLYGSMDGAMKFVKGDAIAGLCIIVVNIVGGIATGIFQHDMSLADAVAIYTTLTVGDGLVAQIPALFIAITAGIIVTRTTSDGSKNNLGSDIGEQVLAQPNALLVAGAACFGLALLPGFPALVFLVFGALIGGAGLAVKSVERQRRDVLGMLTDDIGTHGGMTADRGVTTAPLALSLPAGLADAEGLRRLNAEVDKIRMSINAELGLPFPKIHLQPPDTLAAHDFAIEVRGVPVVSGRLPLDHEFFDGDLALLDALAVNYAGTVVRAPAIPGAWLDSGAVHTLREVGLHALTRSQYVAAQLGAVYRAHATDLFGLQEARSLLDGVQRECPDVVKEVNRVVNLQQLTRILKLLIDEQVCIGDLPAILEILADAARTEKDPAVLAEHVRVGLRRQICHALSSNGGVLPVLMLSAEAETAIRNLSVQPAATGPARLLELKRHLGQALAAYRERSVNDSPAVLLTPPDLRRQVRSLLAPSSPTSPLPTPVLSYRELAAELSVQPLGEVTFA